VISTNRPDGVAVAGHIIDDCCEGGKAGREAFEKILKERNVRFVSYDDWKKIEAAEIENAKGEHPRKKFVTVKEMLDVLDRP
jgi:ferredoxin--NADP+ reductase